MKTVTILVSNYNSFEALQLCIESIQRYTKYLHEILVYDDCSTNDIDQSYLCHVRDKGWIKLILGEKRLNHGGALNVLLENCETDVAMILDNDIQILAPGWLGETIGLINDDVLLMCGIEKDYKSGIPSYPDWFQTWFLALNMKAYKDKMEVDWRRVSDNGMSIPVGAKLHMKLKTKNPKGYKFKSAIPPNIQRKYRHFAHVSCIATADPSDSEKFRKARELKMIPIRKELARIRSL